VAEFLVEQYVPRHDARAVERRGERARRVAEELTRDGTWVRYLRSIFVPEDETCFYLFEAVSADVVRDAALRAGLAFERVTESVRTASGVEK
jgi:hypothetical protein